MVAAFDKIYSEKTGNVGWLYFNDPAKHNAISVDMALAVPKLIDELNADPEIRVVVLAGCGDRSFAAGSNISDFGDVRSDSEKNRYYHDINEQSYNAVYFSEKPTIAMIHGYCIGGGLDFAASCDVRICSPNALFSIPAVKLGLGYGYEGQVRLNRIIGSSRARDLFFTGRKYSAEEALSMGLVGAIVDSEVLRQYVTDYAHGIAENAPLTIKALKAAFIEFEKDECDRNMAKPQALIDRCFESADYLEGRAAFAEKRKAMFQGV